MGSNMSRNVAMWVVALLIAFATAGLAPFGARAQAPGQNWTQSGMLRCKLNPSIGFVIFGHQSMECRFVPSVPGAPQIYEGALARRPGCNNDNHQGGCSKERQKSGYTAWTHHRSHPSKLATMILTVNREMQRGSVQTH